MQLNTRQARNRAILLTLGIFVVMIAAIGIGQQKRDQARIFAPPSYASCQMTQDKADYTMLRYLLAKDTGDTEQMTKLRYGTSYTGCAPAIRGAMEGWFRAVDRGDQAGMTAADEQLIRALR